MRANTPRTAIVTGGAQGIGKATAQRLLRDGYAVVIADIDDEAGRETEQELLADGAARFVRADVGSESEVRHLIEQSVVFFGRRMRC